MRALKDVKGWISKATRDDDDDEYEYEDEEESEGQSTSDVLAQLKIPVEAPVDESVQTSGELSAVRFRISKPKGYLFEDVDKAFAVAVETLKELEKALNGRDLDIHKLATHIDHLDTELQNQKYQLEIFKARGEIITDEDGNPLVVKGEVPVQDIEEIRNQLQQSKAHNKELEDWIAQAQEHISELEAGTQSEESALPAAQETEAGGGEDKVAQLSQDIQQLQTINEEQQEWITQAQEAFSAQEEAYNELKEENAALKEQLAQLESTTQAASGADSGLSDEERESYRALQEWSEQAQESFSALEENYNQAQEAANALGTELQARNDYISELDKYIDELEAYAQQVQEEAQKALNQQASAQQQPEAQASAQVSAAEGSEPSEQPALTEDEEEDDFTKQLREITASEVDLPRRKHSIPLTTHYPPARPGTPLTTLPEGVDLEDYL